MARHIHLLGPVRVTANGEPVALPPSRKVRSLLAYLVLAGPQSRSRLCDLLWDVPNDPRGELRWCLSKLRGVLDDEDRRRVIAEDDVIELDLADCTVDALVLDRTVRGGLVTATREQLLELRAQLGGELLEGVNDGGPELIGWLHAQRHRFRAMHVAVLAALTARAQTTDETFHGLDEWLALAPFDPRAHEAMLDALVAEGRVRDAEAHLSATIQAFEQEGLDWAPLREKWRASRAVVRPVEVVAAPPPPTIATRPRQRASVAIVPFTGETTADGVTEDIITRLAKLRALFVIARGTVYALRDRGIDPAETARILDVDYLASGAVRRDGDRVVVKVELAHAREARIVWTDELSGEMFGIVDRIVAAIAEEIEAAESNRAVLKPPSSLDAWEAYHRGLWHMYKFRGPDNRDAGRFFRVALELDPTFSRAYAGLSFTHFQNAFLDLAGDRAKEIELAYETAAQSLGADDRDPAAHWAMGRALWLRSKHDESIAELQRSIELSPNFALGHYTLGFVQAQTGEPRAAIEATNYSRQLSPFDPLQFGMLASRALAHVRLGELAEAADWAVRAAARPNAHAHILAIAASCLALVNRLDEARALVAKARVVAPSYTIEDFLRAFHFAPDILKLFRRAAGRIGFA